MGGVVAVAVVVVENYLVSLFEGGAEGGDGPVINGDPAGEQDTAVDMALGDATYVVFDVETTGLSIFSDDLACHYLMPYMF